MGALLTMVLRGFASFAGGVAITSLIDKFIPDRVPKLVDPVTFKPQMSWSKLIFFVVLGAIGVAIVRWLGQKLNIKLLK